MAPPRKVPSKSSIVAQREARSFGMRTIIVISLVVCILAVVWAAPHLGEDRFNPHFNRCGEYGTWRDGECMCERHFHGKQCDVYYSRRCTRDDDCGSAHAYCASKNFLQCRLTPHCKDPSGWCMPLDPSRHERDAIV